MFIPCLSFFFESLALYLCYTSERYSASLSTKSFTKNGYSLDNLTQQIKFCRDIVVFISALIKDSIMLSILTLISAARALNLSLLILVSPPIFKLYTKFQRENYSYQYTKQMFESSFKNLVSFMKFWLWMLLNILLFCLSNAISSSFRFYLVSCKQVISLYFFIPNGQLP